MKKDIYQQVTDQIITALEAGTAPWVKPWASAGLDVPRNAVSGRAYSGINTLLLGMAPYTNPQWMTYKQAKEAGGQVRKGERGTTVVFFKPFQVKDKNDPESKEKTIPVLRSYTVFNVEQIDGLPEKFALNIKPQLDSFAENAAAEKLLSLAKIEHGKSRACFIPSLDLIYMPDRLEFKSVPDYYATALHELTHWTGHKSRLERDFSGRFGDSAYAFEELIAEIGAANLCAVCQIDGQLQHASYIENWLKVLKNDKRAIFTAAAQAKKASEFLLGNTEEEEQEPEEMQQAA